MNTATADNCLSQTHAQHPHSERTQKEAIQILFIFIFKYFIIFIAPLYRTSNRELGETAASFPHSQPFCILIPQLLHWLYWRGLPPVFPSTLHHLHCFLAYALHLLSLSSMHPFLEKCNVYGFPGYNHTNKLISLIRVCSFKQWELSVHSRDWKYSPAWVH